MPAPTATEVEPARQRPGRARAVALARLVVPGAGARAVVEYDVMTYRRRWIPFLTGFLEPVFYLFGLGVGLGTLVRSVEVGGTAVAYAEFVAPALLATQAMNCAIFDSVFNLYFKLRITKAYDAVLATPVGPGDIAVGETLWTLVRSGAYTSGFLVVALALGVVPSPWAVLAVPAGMLVTFAFTTIGMTATTYMRDFRDFDYVELVQAPLFLLSATFYPLATYAEGLRWLVQLSPLYHGVALCRGLMLGQLEWALLAHAVVLLVVGAVGLLTTRRRIAALLLT